MALLCVAVLLTVPLGAAAEGWSQEDYELALSFFKGGGSWAFRLVTDPAAAETEEQWKVLVLLRADSKKQGFRLGPVVRGPDSSFDSTRKVLGLYDEDPSTLIQFLKLYAEEIAGGGLEARLVLIEPSQAGSDFTTIAAAKLTRNGLLELVESRD